MADNLDDGEFWLPPQFLADDDVVSTPFDAKFPALRDDAVFFPSEFPYGGVRSSELGSPVDSTVGGSSETESDEEEQLVAELTRRMARPSLLPEVKSVGRFVSGSPQSTLCAFGSGCGCGKSSSQGSPNGVCKFSSAKTTWDLLHAAAGEVERMRLSQESYAFNNQNELLMLPQRKPSPVTTLPSKNSDVGYYTQPSLSHHQQLQIAQFQMLRQQQLAKQQNSVWNVQKQCGGVYPQRQSNQVALTRVRSNDVNVNGVGGRNVRPLGLSASAWPPLQHAKQQNQQYNNGMRAVILGNPSGRRECAGTGVFLPRRVDNPEPRKKPACSTVLVPTRVAQALNLNLDDQPQHLQRFNSNIENGAAALSRVRSNYILSNQKRNLKTQPAVYHEIRLPQEWTY